MLPFTVATCQARTCCPLDEPSTYADSGGQNAVNILSLKSLILMIDHPVPALGNKQSKAAA
jgi:hypothetical protein